MQLTVRVKPRTSVPRVGGVYGKDELVVAVKEPALDGRANTAVLAALAGAFGVSPSAVRLVRGATARSKLVAIEGDEARLMRRLQDLLAG